MLVDGKNLRIVASKEQVTIMGTIGLLCAMVENQLLTVDNAFNALDKMKEGKRRLPWPEAEKILNGLR
jgi:predicted nucleic acid-binding protein